MEYSFANCILQVFHLVTVDISIIRELPDLALNSLIEIFGPRGQTSSFLRSPHAITQAGGDAFL